MEVFIIAAISIFIYMNIGFITAILTKDNGVADIFYGGGFIVIALISYFFTSYKPLSFIMLLLVLTWGTRLAVRIAFRNHGKPEDFRYKKYRDTWGDIFFIRSYLQIFIVQGLVIYIISLPTMFLATYASSNIISFLIIVGLTGWVIGFLFEAIGDLQLDKFIKNPANKGKLLTTGLWRYSRHPNYFGDSLVWWSIAICVFGGIFLNLGIASMIIFISPLLITYTLLRYSGIPMQEKKSKEKPGWDEYAKKTNMFFPWFPKK